MKKILCLFMTMVIVMYSMVALQASEQTQNAGITQGRSGTSSIWKYDEKTKEMIISGSGTVSGLENFDKNKLIEKLVIKSGIETIGDSCFYGYHINEIALEEGLQKIDRGAFYRCEGVKELVIPKSVRFIGGEGLGEISTLAKVTILGNIKTENTIFGNTVAVRILELAGKVDNVAKISASYDATMPEIVLINKNPNYVIRDNLILSADGKILYAENGAVSRYAEKDLNVPKSVERIMPYAFYMRTLKNVRLGKVKSIGKYAFYQSSLKKLTIPSGMTTIGEGAFQQNLLKKVQFHKNIKRIGKRAFYNNELKNVRFYNYPKKGVQAFDKDVSIEHYGHKRVKGITVKATVRQTKRKYIVSLRKTRKKYQKCKIIITQSSKNIIKTVNPAKRYTFSVKMRKGQMGKVHKVYIRVFLSEKWSNKVRIL